MSVGVSHPHLTINLYISCPEQSTKIQLFHPGEANTVIVIFARLLAFLGRYLVGINMTQSIIEGECLGFEEAWFDLAGTTHYFKLKACLMKGNSETLRRKYHYSYICWDRSKNPERISRILEYCNAIG